MSKAKELARHQPTYRSWISMRVRCNSPKSNRYDRYGGRGIKVCEEWNGRGCYPKFLEDMGQRPEGHQIDRIDVNGNYCKENCRWVTMAENMRNTSRNIHLELNGRKMVLAQWARELGMGESSLKRRIFEHGWTVEKALTTPPMDKRIAINGELKPLSEWCRIYNVSESTVRTRIQRNWQKIEAITTPAFKESYEEIKQRIKEAS